MIFPLPNCIYSALALPARGDAILSSLKELNSGWIFDLRARAAIDKMEEDDFVHLLQNLGKETIPDEKLDWFFKLGDRRENEREEMDCFAQLLSIKETTYDPLKPMWNFFPTLVRAFVFAFSEHTRGKAFESHYQAAQFWGLFVAICALPFGAFKVACEFIDSKKWAAAAAAVVSAVALAAFAAYLNYAPPPSVLGLNNWAIRLDESAKEPIFGRDNDVETLVEMGGANTFLVGHHGIGKSLIARAALRILAKEKPVYCITASCLSAETHYNLPNLGARFQFMADQLAGRPALFFFDEFPEGDYASLKAAMELHRKIIVWASMTEEQFARLNDGALSSRFQKYPVENLEATIGAILEKAIPFKLPEEMRAKILREAKKEGDLTPRDALEWTKAKIVAFMNDKRFASLWRDLKTAAGRGELTRYRFTKIKIEGLLASR